MHTEKSTKQTLCLYLIQLCHVHPLIVFLYSASDVISAMFDGNLTAYWGICRNTAWDNNLIWLCCQHSGYATVNCCNTVVDVDVIFIELCMRLSQSFILYNFHIFLDFILHIHCMCTCICFYANSTYLVVCVCAKIRLMFYIIGFIHDSISALFLDRCRFCCFTWL